MALGVLLYTIKVLIFNSCLFSISSILILFFKTNQIRKKSVGVYATLQMFEFVYDLKIPDSVWNGDKWQKMLDICSVLTIYVNDIFSFEKELREEGDINRIFNAVAFLAVQDKIKIERAMDKVAEMITEKERQLIDIENEIMEKKDCLEDTKTFIHHVNYMMGGHTEVSKYLDRYNKFND